ncbi:hypothetical protein [Microbacterium sp. YY-01]|uniref:hypothetical protein n=1 Tax=Microbacterium sp. YY-01 TaxID=3421634 RepID=UPI003D163BBE
MKQRLILIALGGTAAAGIALFLRFTMGVPLSFSLTLVLMTVAIGIVHAVVTGVDTQTHTTWPPPVQHTTYRGSEVSRLAWAINKHTGEVSPGMARRVQKVLNRALVRQGFDPESPSDHTRASREWNAPIDEWLTEPVIRTEQVSDIVALVEKMQSATKQE